MAPVAHVHDEFSYSLARTFLLTDSFDRADREDFCNKKTRKSTKKACLLDQGGKIFFKAYLHTKV